MPNEIFINPGLNLSQAASNVLTEMLKEVPSDTAIAKVEIDKAGTITVATATKFKFGEDSHWIVGIGAYFTKEKDGDTSKGAAVSVSW